MQIDSVLYRERALEARKEKRLQRAAKRQRKLPGAASEQWAQKVIALLADVPPPDAVDILARATARTWKKIKV